jgi:hypothetical protein
MARQMEKGMQPDIIEAGPGKKFSCLQTGESEA